MLKVLTVADARAIAQIALRRSRDERAMVDYLGLGLRRSRRRNERPAAPLLIKPSAVDLAVFESDEKRQLEAALARLSLAARRELIALAWSGRSASLSFEAALRRTRRLPPEAQVAYLLGLRLERHVPAGLEKLGQLRDR